jgi:hypothetical protein
MAQQPKKCNKDYVITGFAFLYLITILKRKPHIFYKNYFLCPDFLDKPFAVVQLYFLT